MAQHLRTPLTAGIEDGDPVALQSRVPVTLRSSDPSKLLLAETASGAARPEITVQFGFTGGSFYADALGSQGDVPIEMSSPGFASGTLTARLTPATIVAAGGQIFSREPETGQSLAIWVGTPNGAARFTRERPPSPCGCHRLTRPSSFPRFHRSSSRLAKTPASGFLFG